MATRTRHDRRVARILLLLPTATYRAADFVDAASSFGAELVIGSEHRQALAETMGDRALLVRLTRPDEAVATICRSFERRALDAIVAVDDQGALVAAMASARLGLRGNPPGAVAATRDKALMRSLLASAGVPQPAYRVVGTDDDVDRVVSEIGLPCVAKPRTLAASRGVIRADDAESLGLALERIRSILADCGDDSTGPLLVERYVGGWEVAVEGLLDSGHLTVLAVFDKPDLLEGPYFEETLYVTPTRLPARDQRAIESLAAEATAALGLTDGPVHIELRGGNGSPRVIELAARSIGGLCSRSLSFGGGHSLEQLIVANALGLPTGSTAADHPASGVMMIPIPRRGTLRGVEGIDQARSVDGITGVEISIARGRAVVPLPEGDRYLGFIFARGQTPVEVERALRRAHGLLEIGVDTGSSPDR